MREDWEYKTFGEIGSFLRGKNIQKADFVSGGLPCIHYGQIHTKFDISIDYHLSEIPQEVYDKAIIASPGDVIIAITSEDIDGSCKSVVWLGNYDIAVSAHAAILKHNMNGKFIAYYLRSNTFFTQKLKYTRGFKVMEIKTKDLAKLVLPIPPKPTQLSIVSELDKLNELIRIKKEQLKDYDALAQSIFYEMFGDPVENEKGWEVKELIETVIPECKISYGIVQPGEHVEDGVPIVRPVDMLQTFISKDGLKKTTKEISNSYNRTILTGKELLICVRGTTGVVSLVDESLKGANVTRGIAPLLFSMDVERWFMYYQIKTPSVRGVISSLTRGIALKQINMSDLRKIQVILPPLPLQQSFAQKIEQIEQQKAAIQKTITDLETLLAARMQYWFD
ncbi:restriction endonuclease subunit S [Prevotella melaninogenica]|uniref:restriction endonuclease subunit S n=1 Tax=Prevotella melaninogenica TaxID=28132 RepID=UPI001C5ECFEA|nr:restriction endonuclease subunit S [Prevotella melaninogenica]MBW4895161.1 restriction endonuclease subunit S [Prevotella melaninogenica]